MAVQTNSSPNNLNKDQQQVTSPPAVENTADGPTIEVMTPSTDVSLTNPIEVMFSYVSPGIAFYKETVNYKGTSDLEAFTDCLFDAYVAEAVSNGKPHAPKSDLLLRYRTSPQSSWELNLTTDLLQQYLSLENPALPLFYVHIAPKTFTRKEFDKLCKERNTYTSIANQSEPVTVPQLKRTHDEIYGPDVAWRTWISMYESGKYSITTLPSELAHLFALKENKPSLRLTPDPAFVQSIVAFVSDRLTAMNLEVKKMMEAEHERLLVDLKEYIRTGRFRRSSETSDHSNAEPVKKLHANDS
ncbi:hypothetical protein GEMRC1_001209 [Eukaryota sp. GEM-RC1]